ncbi:MAG: hypothetical protein Q8N78_03975 [Sulfurimonas sp.]|jgi:hypothetical protein|nr:hypothetical protein [Sulfurimonas sp.]
MKKVLSIVVASVATFTLMTGCSATAGAEKGADMESGDATLCKTAIYIGDRSNKSVIKAIESAGEKNGWRMTHFKANAIVGEKSVDDKTISTTIQIEKEYITCVKDKLPQSELEALRASIIEELKKDKKGGRH